MISRKDLIEKIASHREYYGQFVCDSNVAFISRHFGIDELVKAFQLDESFNTISLKRWDDLPIPTGLGSKLKETGDTLSLSGVVCTWKEAARQAVEIHLSDSLVND